MRKWFRRRWVRFCLTLAWMKRSWDVIVRERCPDCHRRLLPEPGTDKTLGRYCPNPACRVDGKMVNMLDRIGLVYMKRHH